METQNYIPINPRAQLTPSEIIVFAADLNYTEIHLLNGRKIVVGTTLKKFERSVADDARFFRTHRSFLINLNYIKSCDFNGGGEIIVKMTNDYCVIVSRRNKLEFKRLYSKNKNKLSS